MEEGVIIIMRYSDNLLIVSPSNLNTLLAQCDHLKVPVASEKIESPATCIPFWHWDWY